MRLEVRKGLWLVASLLVIAVLLAGGCAGHPKGMKSLRWLTDAEKERVIKIALKTPEALSLLEQENYYEVRVNWVALSWQNGTVGYGFDYESVDEGVRTHIPESAESYSQVEIYFGKPEHSLLRVAINPDTEKVALAEIHGLKKLPAAP